MRFCELRSFIISHLLNVFCKYDSFIHGLASIRDFVCVEPSTTVSNYTNRYKHMFSDLHDSNRYILSNLHNITTNYSPCYCNL